MKKLIVVADWASDPLYFTQFQTAIEGHVKDLSAPLLMRRVPVTPSTIHASYIVRQLIETESRMGRPEETVIYVQTDARSESADVRESPKGAPLYINRLSNGIFVVGTNAGYTFSLIKDQIAEVFTYGMQSNATQFSARDVYARTCAYLMDYMEDELEFDEAHSSTMLELPNHRVGHVDVFGNIQTTITVEDVRGHVELHQQTEVNVNGHVLHATYLPHRYAHAPGSLVLAASSTGDTDNPFMELSVWNQNLRDGAHSAAALFHHPIPGDHVVLKR